MITMKRILIAIVIGIALTVVFFALAGFFGGACHCVTPTTIFFPYAGIVFGTTSWNSIGLVLIAFQFPLYAITLVCIRGIKRRVLAFTILLLAHSTALLIGLKVYHH
jgi:hypothetical protein